MLTATATSPWRGWRSGCPASTHPARRSSSRTTWAKSEGLGPDVSGPFDPHIEQSRPGMDEPVQRLPDMDEEGIDVAVIFGTPIALSVNGLQDEGLAAALKG